MSADFTLQQKKEGFHMGVNPNPFSHQRTEAAAAANHLAAYEDALKEHKAQMAAKGLPWNSVEAERFDHQWRIEHIPLPEGFSLKKPKKLLLLLICLIFALLLLSWAYTDAFVHGNSHSLIAFAGILLPSLWGAWSLIRQCIEARRMKRIGAEAWLHQEATRQKSKGIHPWNASEHAPWM